MNCSHPTHAKIGLPVAGSVQADVVNRLVLSWSEKTFWFCCGLSSCSEIPGLTKSNEPSAPSGAPGHWPTWQIVPVDPDAGTEATISLSLPT